MLTDKGFATILVITFVLSHARMGLQVAHQGAGALVHLLAQVACVLCVLFEAMCLQCAFYIKCRLTFFTFVGTRMGMSQLDVNI